MRADWHAHRRMKETSRGRKVLKKTNKLFFSFGSGEVALSQGNTSKKSAKAPETSRLEPQKNLTLQSPYKA